MKNKTLKRIERLLWSLVLAGAAVYLLTGCEARVQVKSADANAPIETSSWNVGDKVRVEVGGAWSTGTRIATGVVVDGPFIGGTMSVLFIDSEGTPTRLNVPVSILIRE